MDTEKQIEKLLKLFNKNKVMYVIIGATALPIYGHVRATIDVDIFIKPTEENAKRAIKSLKEFGYLVIEGIKVKEFLKKKILIRQYLLETDIHPFVKGISFEDVWKNKIRAKIGNTYAYFPSLDDMIRMKKSACRAIDKEDLKYLIKLRKLKRKK